MKKLTLIILLFIVPIVSCSNNAQDDIDQGYQGILDNDYPAALEAFTKAIEKDPNSVEAYNNRGIVLGILGEHVLAIQDFNKAIELDPQNSEAYKSRGIAKLYLQQKTTGCSDLRIANKMGYVGARDLIDEFCFE